MRGYQLIEKTSAIYLIWPRDSFLIWVNIGCIGRHVISSLCDVRKRQFIQNGGRKYRVFKSKTELIKALAPKVCK